jgi:DNA mismatch endonuclease, patch repair protein
MDIVSNEVRSRMMSRVRRQHSAPELAVRGQLFRKGFRYRLHPPWMPGTPDFVLPRYRAVVFVHGCFWHRHAGCVLAAVPKTNSQFWAKKFASNEARDSDAVNKTLMLGWRVAIVWECAVRATPEAVGHRLATWLVGKKPEIEIGATGLARDVGRLSRGS